MYGQDRRLLLSQSQINAGAPQTAGKRGIGKRFSAKVVLPELPVSTLHIPKKKSEDRVYLTLFFALGGCGAPSAVPLTHALLGSGHPKVLLAFVVDAGSEVVSAHPEFSVLHRLQLVAVEV